MNFNLKYVFYVGLVTKEGQAIDKDFAIKTISASLAAFGIDGFSAQEITGFYKGVEEKSLVVTVFDASKEACGEVNAFYPYLIAEDFVKGLFQESVLVETVQNVKAELVFA